MSRLESILDLIPEPTHAAFEFRHESWYDEDVLNLLRNRNLALCVADTNNALEAPMLGTASWGYLRLRREAYSHSDLLRERAGVRVLLGECLIASQVSQSRGPIATLFVKLCEIVVSVRKIGR